MKAVESGGREGSPESWPELHEEIARLPERYREPVVLCYLEGLSTEAAALRIGCPRGTVLSRLSRARERLRGRLARRGLMPPALLIAVGPTGRAEALPASLLRMTVRTSLGFAGERAAEASLATNSSAELARGVLFAMTISKLKVLASIVAACLIAAGGMHAIARPANPVAIERRGGDHRGDKVAAQVEDGPEETILRRREDVLKRLKIEVEKLGGSVSDNGDTVSLDRTSASDADLERIVPLLRDVPQLTRLFLGHSLITDAGLRHLRDLVPLTRLFLENTDVTDAGLAHLKGLKNLVGFSLENTGVGDEGMKILAGMPGMARVSLGNTRVGDEGLRRLGGLDHLMDLTLENTPITDAGLVHLKGLTRLRHLHLDNTRITDAGLASLKGLVRLQRLHLCDTDVSDAGLVNLESMKELYYLMLHNTLDPKLGEIRDTVKVSDAGLVHLRGLTNLRSGSLFLWNTSVTEEGAASLRKVLPQLDGIAIGEKRIIGFQSGHPPRGKR